jgi:hypothetical protein
MITWSDVTMKAISKVRLILGTISMSGLTLAILVGLSAPAIAPSRADALTAQLAQYQNATKLSDKQLVGLLKVVGFKGKHLQEAWAVAKKESHGNPLSYNGNRKTGDNSYGLFQVNMLGQMGADRRAQYGLAKNAELLNPVVNAKIAYQMSNGGKNWSAWKGVHTQVVRLWLTKYPYKATTTKAHKPKAKAKAIAKAKPKHKQ